MVDESDSTLADLDQTDELPVLSEEAIIAAGGEIPTLDDETVQQPRPPKRPARPAPPHAEPSADEATVRAPAPESASVAAIERDLAELRSRWGSVEDMLVANSTAINTLQQELALSRQQLEQSQSRQQELTAELANRRDESEASDDAAGTSEFEETSAAVEELRARCQQLESKRAEAESKATELEEETARAQTRLETLETERDLIRTRAEALESERDEVQSRSYSLEAERDEAEAAKASIETQRDEAEARASLLETERDAADARAKTLEAARNETEARCISLEAERREAETRATTLEAERDEARAELHAIRDDAAKASQNRSELQTQLDRIASLETYIAGRADRWREMESLVASGAQRTNELERELEQRVAREEQLEQRFHEEQAIAVELREKLTALGQSIANQHSELSILRGAQPGDSARQEASTADQLAASLQSEVVELHDTLRARERDAQDLGEENDRLRQQLGAAEKDLEEARGQLSRLARDLEEELSAEHQDADPTVSRTPETSTKPELICLTSAKPEHYSLDKPKVTIGRGSDCDIQVLTHFVSREHAELHAEDGHIVIEDLGSTNGVFVNSVRVEKQTLHHGDWVTIGETQFRYLSGDDADDPQ